MIARSLFFGSCLVCATLAVSCAQPTTTTLAIFDHGTVEVDELDHHMRSLPEGVRQPPQGRSVNAWLEEQVLDVAIEETLLARARAEGADADPAVQLRARYLASRELGAAFAQESCPEADVTDAAVEAAYDVRVPRQAQPWILLRHIFKRVPPSAPPARRQAVRAEMEGLLRQLDDGASFTALAMEHSGSDTAGDGGLIGRVSRNAPMEPAVLDAGWSLPDGGYSGVVAVDNGFHIVRRDSSGVQQPPSLDEARERLREQLVREQRELCGQALLRELAQATKVVVDLNAALDPSADAPVVTVGEEVFTAQALRALSDDWAPISELQDLPAVLQGFVEALLLADAARAESDEAEARFRRLEAEALRQVMLTQRWSTERLRFVDGKGGDELEAFHRANAERFASDVMVDLSVIVLHGAPTSDDRTVNERAWAVRGAIAAGEPFADVARRESGHPSSEHGGHLGRVPLPKLRTMLGADGYRAVTSLEPGQVSEPFRVALRPAPSWALVTVHHREEPQPRTFEEARNDVVAALAQERVQSLNRELRDVLREEIRFKLRERALQTYIQALGGGGE